MLVYWRADLSVSSIYYTSGWYYAGGGAVRIRRMVYAMAAASGRRMGMGLRLGDTIISINSSGTIILIGTPTLTVIVTSIEAAPETHGSTTRVTGVVRLIRTVRRQANMAVTRAATRCPAGNQVPASRSTARVEIFKAGTRPSSSGNPYSNRSSSSSAANRNRIASGTVICHAPLEAAAEMRWVQRAGLGVMSDAVTRYNGEDPLRATPAVLPACALRGEAAGAEEIGKMMRRTDMKFETAKLKILRSIHIVVAIVFFCCLSIGILSAQQTQSKAASTPVIPQKTFSSPEEAADALIAAADKFDVDALIQVFGSKGKDLVLTSEPPRDKEVAKDFAERAHQKKSVVVDPKNKNLALLIIGNEDWPMAVPIIKKNGKWLFDIAAGREELLYRRIGGNELDAIEVCRGYVDAQEEYALQLHDGSTLNQYAQRIISTPGKQDGLAWKNADGTFGGPIGEEAAEAIAEGYTRDLPYHGYYYKILKGQGPAAPLGKMDYLVNGAMIGGFALAAAPAEYSVTGVMTFIVSNDGIVYQKDFGPKTLDEFKKLEIFNPDKTWTPVPALVE